MQVRWLASRVVPPGNKCSPASGRRHTSTNKTKKKCQHTVLGTDRNEVVGYSQVVPPIGYKLGGCISKLPCVYYMQQIREYRSYRCHLLFELYRSRLFGTSKCLWYWAYTTHFSWGVVIDDASATGILHGYPRIYFLPWSIVFSLIKSSSRDHLSIHTTL